MNDIEKLRVLVQHWIEHNGGHVEEFLKWRDIMMQDRQEQPVASLEKAAAEMEKVSGTLKNLLEQLGGTLENHHHEHHDHHGHHHHH